MYTNIFCHIFVVFLCLLIMILNQLLLNSDNKFDGKCQKSNNWKSKLKLFHHLSESIEISIFFSNNFCYTVIFLKCSDAVHYSCIFYCTEPIIGT